MKPVCAADRGCWRVPVFAEETKLTRQVSIPSTRRNDMPWMDQVGSLLKQYTSGGTAAAAAPAPDVHAHFDQVAAAAPQSTIAEGLAAAFHSDQTPAFGTMLSGLFANSTGEQKAGLLNQLLANVNPAMLSSIAGGGALAGLLKSGGEITPEHAQPGLP